MALNGTAALAISKAYKYLRTSFPDKFLSAVDCGNQRLTASNKVLNSISSDLAVDLTELCSFSLEERLPLSADFYKLLGFDEYLAIDLNTKMNAVRMDLNYCLHKKYDFQKQFDLVINNGTGEHLFNQYQLFDNIHNLCSPGGIMLNILPFYPNINHGFFNYSPVLFRDLAYANGYTPAFFGLAELYTHNYKEFNPFGEVATERKGRPFSIPFRKYIRGVRFSAIEKFLFHYSKMGHVYIVSAFIKSADNPFKMPLQGKWIHNIDDDDTSLTPYLQQPDTFKEFHS